MAAGASKPFSRIGGVFGQSRFGRMLRKLVKICAILALVPVALTILYIPSVVHPVSTLMLKDLLTMQGYERQWVSIDNIAPALIHSVMMSEDGQFCAHQGVDWSAINQVIDDAMEGEGSRGASTIPMQTVKNLYLWNSRSYLRKVLELPYALMVDLFWTKRRLMEIYLNIAEWGPGVYGVEAAAQRHFGVSARTCRGGRRRCSPWRCPTRSCANRRSRPRASTGWRG